MGRWFEPSRGSNFFVSPSGGKKVARGFCPSGKSKGLLLKNNQNRGVSEAIRRETEATVSSIRRKYLNTYNTTSQKNFP
jgi:hypothetical protein